MLKNRSLSFWYHALALLTVVVWGTTFISTKVLIFHGLSPEGIMLLRFLIAYVCIWPFTKKRLFGKNVKDELLFLAAGVTGGSLYFWAENTALQHSLASNVALIVCVAPILTALVFWLFRKDEVLRRNLLYGSIVAFSGVAVVMFGGQEHFRLQPLGDTLAVLAALMWAFYGLVTKGLNLRYPSMFVTRKVFFYGILTILPVVLARPSFVDFRVLLEPEVWMNLLFLGVVASMLCFYTWNIVTRSLGVVRVTNYIYVSPLVTVLTAALFLGERLPWPAYPGALLIVGGVWFAARHEKTPTAVGPSGSR